MPSGFGIKLTRDDMTPAVVKTLRTVKHPAVVMRAIGTQIVSIAKRAFRDSSYRSAPWRAKRDGSPATLIFKGALISSIRIQRVTDQELVVGSDRQYAAIHQLGGVITPKAGKLLVFTSGGRTFFAKKVTMPARPYFPFLPDGSLAPLAVKPVRDISAEVLSRETRP